MKLAYITNARIPSERANAIQTAQMCAAFASAGANATLYYPDRRNLPEYEGVDVWAYYGVARTFAKCSVPCVDWFHLSGKRAWIEGPIFLLQTITFAVSLIQWLRRAPADIYFSRDPLVLALMVLLLPGVRRRMLFEAHAFPTTQIGRIFRRWVLNQIGGTVAINFALEKMYTELGVRSVMVAPDGVSLERFSQPLTQMEARRQLGLPLDRPLLTYTGGLYPGRGIEEMVVAVKTLKAELVIVGGKDELAMARFQRYAADAGVTNVRFEGHRPPTMIPAYLAAADLLAMPYSRRTVAPGGVTTDWMSPLKMFEYMAATRPIVASDLPALREILNDGNALLVPPDDSAALRAAFQRLLSDPALRHRLAVQARQDVERYTWESRARSILEFASSQREETET